MEVKAIVPMSVPVIHDSRSPSPCERFISIPNPSNLKTLTTAETPISHCQQAQLPVRPTHTVDTKQ
jgi:hypothetical protein